MDKIFKYIKLNTILKNNIFLLLMHSFFTNPSEKCIRPMIINRSFFVSLLGYLGQPGNIEGTTPPASLGYSKGY